jgi:hypothetical protein
MKKTILLVALFMLTMSSAFATYTRTTENGGPNGYDYASAVTDEQGNTTIKCRNPGYEACPTKAANLTTTQKNLLNYAASRIQNGFLSGSYTLNGQTITWVSDSVEMLNSTITIN